MYGGTFPLVKRQGGKFYMYKKIIALFPKDYEDMMYVEPFVGGGSIFFNKNPSKKEVINDKDEILHHFYKMVQDDYKDVEQRINGNYSEKDFYKLRDMKPTSMSGLAIQDYLLKRLSYIGTGKIFDFEKSRRNKNFEIDIDKDLAAYAERLAHTTILNKDFKKVIDMYDSPNTLFYLDPPYENSNKTIENYKDIDLDELAHILTHLKGKFIMSINDSKANRVRFKRFHIGTLTTRYALKTRVVTELIIKNY